MRAVAPASSLPISWQCFLRKCCYFWPTVDHTFLLGRWIYVGLTLNRPDFVTISRVWYRLWGGSSHASLFKVNEEGLPCGPVVKTLCFRTQGAPGSISGQGAKILHTTWHSQKQKGELGMFPSSVWCPFAETHTSKHGDPWRHSSFTRPTLLSHKMFKEVGVATQILDLTISTGEGGACLSFLLPPRYSH